MGGVSFRVPPGATVALVGATGAGKSTLVSLIPRFFDPWAGRVLIDGADVRLYFPNPKAQLPVKTRTGSVALLVWGRRHEQAGQLPLGGVGRVRHDAPAASCVRPPLAGGGAAIKAAVPRGELPTLIPRLKEAGGSDVVITEIAQIVP